MRIILVGATGRTGNAVAHGLVGRDDVELAACVAPSVGGSPTRDLPADVPAFSSLDAVTVEADVVVDLGVAEAVLGHLDVALSRGWHVVLGTTGVRESKLDGEGARFAAAGLGLCVVPNFSVGAVLMMELASIAARLMPDVEIVELHHATKRDAPSGTAIRTASMIAAARRDAGIGESGTAPGDAEQARGERHDGIAVHSLRIRGAMAHQEVVFGGPGEMLSIRHDAVDRGCYAAGVALSARRVIGTTGRTTGLELK